MRILRSTLFLGIFSVLALAPACSNGSGGGGVLPAIAAILAWTSPAAQFMLPRAATYPRTIETLILRHNGGAGDVEYEFSDASGALAASPAKGILTPGQQVAIIITAVALVAYTTVTMTMKAKYAGGLTADELVVPFAFALMPPAMFVISLLATGEPGIPALFLAALIFGSIGVLVKWSGTGGLDRIPLLRYTEIVLMAVVLLALSLAQIRANFYRNVNEPESNAQVNFPPGQGKIGYTIHPKMEVDITPGEFRVFHSMMQLPIPVKDPVTSQLHTYAFVIDTDADAKNNWKPLPAFPNDFYKDTDRWYEMSYSTAGGWVLTVKQVDENNKVTEIASAARAIIVEDAIVLVVPKSEVPNDGALWRATSFVHQGDFGANSPFLWSGDTEPPVDKPLLPLIKK